MRNCRCRNRRFDLNPFDCTQHGKPKRQPVIGDKMWFTKKTARIVLLLSIGILFSVAIVFYGKNYPLNKTVREVSLRLVQIRRLSMTRQIDYKVVFCREHYFIDYFDEDEKSWKRYIKSNYHNGVLSELDGVELIFVKGRFKDYRLKEQEGKIFKYVIISFYSQNSPKKKAIIFYRTGDWKVLI